MEKKFNEEDSMLVIRQMIEQAKGNIEKGEGKYFILWGYLVSLSCLIHYVLYKFFDLDPGIASVVWLISTPIGIVISFVFAWKEIKKETVKTYVGTMISRIWVGFAIMSMAIFFLLAGKYGMYIYPAISLVYAYATFISAGAYRMKWMYLSAIFCLICVVLYKFVPFNEYPLLMGSMLLCGNLIPGHIINYKARKHV